MNRVVCACVWLSEMVSAAEPRLRPDKWTKPSKNLFKLFIEEIWVSAIYSSACVVEKASVERWQLMTAQFVDRLKFELRSSSDIIGVFTSVPEASQTQRLVAGIYTVMGPCICHESGCSKLVETVRQVGSPPRHNRAELRPRTCEFSPRVQGHMDQNVKCC